MTPRTFDDLQEDVRTALAEVADGNPVPIEDHGKARYAIISLHGLKLLSACIEAVEDRINREEAAKTLLEIAREGAIPYA